jgi:hypothetical protein
MRLQEIGDLLQAHQDGILHHRIGEEIRPGRWTIALDMGECTPDQHKVRLKGISS